AEAFCIGIILLAAALRVVSWIVFWILLFLGSLKLRILSLHPRCPCPRIRCWPSDLEPLGVWPASSCSHKKGPGCDRGQRQKELGESSPIRRNVSGKHPR